MLAQKISILFGTVVLCIIAVTLIFPWLQMGALDEQAMLLRARQVALAVMQTFDVRASDWVDLQRRIDERWDEFADEIGIPSPPPRVISRDVAGGGFQREAIDYLLRHSGERYYWRLQDEDRSFRFAMALRGDVLDDYPGALRGIIDVKLRVPHGPSVWNAVITVLAGASGAVLAILLFYLVLQRLVLSPVRALRDTAERVTGGELDVHAQIESGDEFQDLAHTFNDMLAHLKAARDEQERINRSLDVKLGELAEANVALYESSRIKGEFLANVTHELRTPLVSIIGFAELLVDAADGEQIDRKRVARYSRNILNSGRSLLDLINDLLDLAKIEAGRLELHIAEFDIGDLCQDIIDLVQPLADNKRQTLELHLADDLPRARSDAGRIKQILYNLLSNAIKFTPEKGRVFLDVAGVENEFMLTVRDTGVGIPAGERETIFEKFRQLDASTTREYAGSGLGLTITRDLVQMLGGRIDFTSEVGAGTAFVVRIPVEAPETSRRVSVRL